MTVLEIYVCVRIPMPINSYCPVCCDENILIFIWMWYRYDNYLLLLLNGVGSARLRESDQHPVSPKTLAPQYQPIDREMRRRSEIASSICCSKIKSIQCILWAVHCLCSMCQRMLLVVLWLVIGTRLRLLAVGLLSTAEPLYRSRRLFRTILVILCLMVCDWRVLRE